MVKKKIAKEDIDNVKSSLYFKIFDIYIDNNKNKYFIDKEFNLIWDINKEVVGILDNKNNINNKIIKNNYYFFNDLDVIIDAVKTDIENNFSNLNF